MKFVKHDKKTDLFSITSYPRIDFAPIEGLNPNIEYYVLNEYNKTDIDTNYFDISVSFLSTEKPHPVYSHLKICDEIITTTRKSNEEIIEAMNYTFGKFMDENYPIAIRVKDINFPNEKTTERRAKESTLRTERENRENDLINTNILPSFDWVW